MRSCVCTSQTLKLLVRAAGEKLVRRGVKRHREHLRDVAFQFRQFLVRFQVPELDEFVAARGGEQFAVGADREIKDSVRPGRPGSREGGIGRAGQADDAAFRDAAIGDDELAAVGEEAQGGDAIRSGRR